MIVGIDFDNTLVSYDGLFHAAAVELGFMPGDGPTDKRGVREWLVERGEEDRFTLLQGYVYGPGLKSAKPYPGAFSCLSEWKKTGAEVYVVSHKTRRPYSGPAYDLRRASRKWLSDAGLFASGLLEPDRVFFEDTVEDKIARITMLHCDCFVDDMERILTHPFFPKETVCLLFYPGAGGDGIPPDGIAAVCRSWDAIGKYCADMFC